MATKPKTAAPRKDPGPFRSGQWVRFELDTPDGSPLQVIVVEGKRASRVAIADPAEVALIVARMQKGKDGRFVGIHLAAARTPTGTSDASGQPEYAHMPACVAPQRQILGPSGEQNIGWLWKGQNQTVLLPLDSLRHVEATVDRGDIPKHRDATCHPNWNPRR